MMNYQNKKSVFVKLYFYLAIALLFLASLLNFHITFVVSGKESFTELGLNLSLNYTHLVIFGFAPFFFMGYVFFLLTENLSLTVNVKGMLISLLLLFLGLAGRIIFSLRSIPGGFFAIETVAAVLECLGILFFSITTLPAINNSKSNPTLSARLISAGIIWFVLMAILETIVYLNVAATSNRSEAIGILATFQGPVMMIQIFGFILILLMGTILGIVSNNEEKPFAGRVALNFWLLNIFVFLCGISLVSMRLFREIKMAQRGFSGIWLLSIIIITVTALNIFIKDIRPRIQHKTTENYYLTFSGISLTVVFAMFIFLPIHQFGIIEKLAPDSPAAAIHFSHVYFFSIIHIFIYGFIFLGIMGLLPQIANLRIQAWYLPVLLSGVILRALTEILSDFTTKIYPIVPVSGALELIAVGAFCFNAFRTMKLSGLKLLPA